MGSDQVEKMTIIGPIKLSNKQLAAILLVLAVLPVFYPLGLPLKATQFTQDFYNAVEALEPGAVTAWAGLFSFRRYVQNRDAVRAVLVHMARRYTGPNKIKMIFYGFFGESPEAIYANVRYARLEEDYGYVYGEDYAVFPYLAGEESALAAVADNMRLLNLDILGNSIDSLSVMDGINTLDDVDLGVLPPYEVLTFGAEAARQWGARGLKIIDGSNYAPIAPYYGPDKYFLGALDADRGMAEYEVLVGLPGSEAAKMDIRNVVGITIMALTLLAVANDLVTKQNKEVKVE